MFYSIETFVYEPHVFGTQRQRRVEEPVKHPWWNLLFVLKYTTIKGNLEILNLELSFDLS